MSPLVHTTIIGLALLLLFAGYMTWSIRKLYNLNNHINMIEDFVKYKAKLDLAKNNPSKMMTLYKNYMEGGA